MKVVAGGVSPLVLDDAKVRKLARFFGTLDELVDGSVVSVVVVMKEHGVQHRCSFSAVEESERCHSSGFLLGRIVRECDVGQNCIPGPVFYVSVHAEHVGDSFV